MIVICKKTWNRNNISYSILSNRENYPSAFSLLIAMFWVQNYSYVLYSDQIQRAHDIISERFNTCKNSLPALNCTIVYFCCQNSYTPTTQAIFALTSLHLQVILVQPWHKAIFYIFTGNLLHLGQRIFGSYSLPITNCDKAKAVIAQIWKTWICIIRWVEKYRTLQFWPE